MSSAYALINYILLLFNFATQITLCIRYMAILKIKLNERLRGFHDDKKISHHHLFLIQAAIQYVLINFALLNELSSENKKWTHRESILDFYFRIKYW